MPGIEKAAGSAAQVFATYDAGPITTETPDAPPPAEKAPPSAETSAIVKTVKGAEAERELGRYRRLLEAQKKEGQSSRDVGLCKTLVSGGVALGATIAAGAVTRNPYAAAAVGASGKAMGDGIAFQLCDPEAGK